MAAFQKPANRPETQSLKVKLERLPLGLRADAQVLDSMPKTARLASISLPCLDDAVFGAIRRPTFWTIHRGFFLYKLSQYNGCYTKLTMPKIVRLYAPVGDGNWQLFNLAKDKSEQTDLVKLYNLDNFNILDPQVNGNILSLAQKYYELRRDWDAYVVHNNVIQLGYDYGYGWLDDSLIH